MDTLPLFHLFSFLSVKYALWIIILSIILSVATEVLLVSEPTSPLITIVDALALSAMMFLMGFIVLVIYKVYIGDRFQFMPLAASASILLFSTSLLVAVRIGLSNGSGFHVVQILLALIGSVAMGVVFSTFVKVAQRFISA